MAISIQDIPLDVFSNNIVSFMNIFNIIKMSCVSKTYIKDQEEYINMIINKNDFFKKYGTQLCLNIVSLIKNSIFSFQLFECYIEYIENDRIDDLNYQIDNINISQQTIVSSIKVFQLFMSYAIEINCTSITQYYISKHMVKYFKQTYNLRSGFREYDEIILRYFILYSDDWHLINFNIYTLYENYNLLSSSNRSFLFKQYLEYNKTNIIYKYHDFDYQEVLNLLIEVMKYGCDKIKKAYCFFEIIKFLNNMQENSYKFSDIFIETAIKKIIEIGNDIKKLNISRYFKKHISKEFQKFIDFNLQSVALECLEK